MGGVFTKVKLMTLPEWSQVIQPSMLVSPTRTGRKLVFTGDCRPSRSTVDIAQDADLLIHEATFAQEEAARAIGNWTFDCAGCCHRCATCLR